ncbi:MAG: MFS transporter [Anaerolineae bacterium]|jgi:MFS family permease
MINGVVLYWKQLRSFGRNARLYLLSEVIIGLAFSVYMLIFNLYIVSRGYPRSFLGELQSLPNLISLFGAVPAGVLVDAIGRKRALVLANVLQTLGALGIVLSPGPSWLRLSMITFGVSQSLWMVSSAPFLMENSTEKERNVLFSAHFGLTTLVGFVGTLVGGYLPTVFGGLLSVDVESSAAYATTLGVTVALSAVSLLPVLLIEDGHRPVRTGLRSWLPWRNIQNRGLAFRIFLPNITISLGAAILIPYMNLFFKETYPISDKMLGTLFAVSSVITGVATMASPLLAARWGRIRALVFTQLASIPFLLLIGFSGNFWVSGMSFWVRAALMNMGNPLYNAFAMEQFGERERATVSGLMGMSWNIGWTIGPFVSGYMQSSPSIGFPPIFVITCSFYIVAATLEKLFFQRMDDRQTRAALLKQLNVLDMTRENVI